MGKVYEGDLIVRGKKFVIIVSRFNEFISGKLLDGAMDALIRHGAKKEEVDIVWVPGAFEIAGAARRIAGGGKYDAIVCLGAVIRGETPHFDYVCAQVTRGIGQISLEGEVPISFGIVTANTLEQAVDRAGTKSGNKGSDAALTAVEMLNLYEKIGK